MNDTGKGASAGEGLVVVGVDGSGPARTALEFAVAEAARRGARLRVVIAFHPPQIWPMPLGPGATAVLPPSVEELREAAERTVAQAVAEVGADAGVALEIRTVQGYPAQVLVDQSEDADLLVVGHRGLGGFASACLGSVGLQSVLHATCPVTVVRPVAAAEPEPERATAAAAAR